MEEMHWIREIAASGRSEDVRKLAANVQKWLSTTKTGSNGTRWEGMMGTRGGTTTDTSRLLGKRYRGAILSRLRIATNMLNTISE
jgi:hypothetical protein